MRIRFKALGLGLALTSWAISPAARAQTFLDKVLADPSSGKPEFRTLLPNNGLLESQAWGTSAGGSYVVGNSSVTNATCTSLVSSGSCGPIAAVWAPGTGDGSDLPTILPFASNQNLSSFDTFESWARGISGSGDTIVGWSFLECGGLCDVFDALAWTRGPGQSDWVAFALPPDPTFATSTPALAARGVSEDGSTAVGWSGENPGNALGDIQATIWSRTGAGATDWSNGARLGVVGTTDQSVANGVALDASGNRIVVGWSGGLSSCNNCVVIDGSDRPANIFSTLWAPNAAVWVVNPSPSNTVSQKFALNALPSSARSDATAISADASTIVGWSDSPVVNPGDPTVQAVLWRNTSSGFQSATPQALGVFALPSNIQVSGVFPLGSVALAVSDHGDAVVGYETFGPSPTVPEVNLAFVWTKGFSDGKGRYLGDVLKQAGVSLGNWVLFQATGVRSTSDGFVVVGFGCDSGVFGCSIDPGFIVRIGAVSGITTPAQQIQSFNQISSAALAVGTNVGATLTGLEDMAENHRCIRPQDEPTGKWCFFGFGTGGLFDSGDVVDGGQFSGDVGIAHYLTPVTSVGVDVGSGLVNTDLQYGGSYRENEVHVGGYAAHIPDTGWRLFGAGLWGNLSNIDITRGYLNGLGYSDSFGSTNGDGWGLLGRLGFGFRANAHTLLTPFTQVTYTDAHLNGYRESGGPFPATFQDVDTNTTVGRAGVLEETDLSPTIRVFDSAAWAQVLDSQTPFIKGAVLDIFELSNNGSGNESGWAEFMAGGRYQLSQDGVLSVSASADTQFNDFFSLSGHIGYSQVF